jgi:Cu+-exporting ATPase
MPWLRLDPDAARHPGAHYSRLLFYKRFQRPGAPRAQHEHVVALGSAASFLFGVFALYRIGDGLGAGDHALVDRYLNQLYFESSAMILVLISIGKTLEARAKGKTSEALTGMMDLVPRTALVVRGEDRVEIDAADLRVGDHVVLLPGSRAPCDGVVVDGHSSIDESAMTGESVRWKNSRRPGDERHHQRHRHADLQGDQDRRRHDALADDSADGGGIVLESAGGAPADKVAGIFVPVVLGIALITLIAWLASDTLSNGRFRWPFPCWLSPAPVRWAWPRPRPSWWARARARSTGILIKSGEALEGLAGSLDDVVLDKTGTLTIGRPRGHRRHRAARHGRRVGDAGGDAGSALRTSAGRRRLARGRTARPRRALAVEAI